MKGHAYVDKAKMIIAVTVTRASMVEDVEEESRGYDGANKNMNEGDGDIDGGTKDDDKGQSA